MATQRRATAEAEKRTTDASDPALCPGPGEIPAAPAAAAADSSTRMATGNSGGSDGGGAGSPGNDVLDVGLKSLECLAAEPQSEKPRELTVYSTTLKDDQRLCEERGDAENLPEKLKSITATSTCKRTLHEEPTAHRMDFLKPNNLDEVNFNLYSGFGSQTDREDENEYLNVLLECLEKEGLAGESDFVSTRYTLVELGIDPYEAGRPRNTGLKIVVQKLGRVFYMHHFPTDKAKSQEDNRSVDDKKRGYGGKKFESYLTAKPGKPPNTSPFNDNHKFYSVVRSEIGPHSLIYYCGIDCCDPDDQEQYIDLRSTAVLTNGNHWRQLSRFKRIRWWLQSYLTGIHRIFAGFRHNSGVVRRCEWYEVSEIKDSFGQGDPKPSACLAFIESFLTFVRTKVDKDLDVYVFTREAGKMEFTVELDESREHKFLPYWFVDKCINDDKA